MKTRLELHEMLCNVLGSRNVYFQPPESVKMKYPAIVYSRSDMPSTFADDLAYLTSGEYLVTLIDKDPDSMILEKLLNLPQCRYDRHYAADNLNHDIFIITI